MFVIDFTALVSPAQFTLVFFGRFFSLVSRNGKMKNWEPFDFSAGSQHGQIHEEFEDVAMERPNAVVIGTAGGPKLHGLDPNFHMSHVRT